MKTIIAGFALFCFLQITAFSQTTSTWMGGTPGKVSDWNCSTNWKEGRVPDENAQVIIPSDLIYYPVIRSQVTDIDALLVTGSAKVSILASGSLTILGSTGRLDVLTVRGVILNQGQLRVKAKDDSQPDELAPLHRNRIVHF